MPTVRLTAISAAQAFAVLSIIVALQIAVPLTHQFLGAGIGADFTAALPAATRNGSGNTN